MSSELDFPDRIIKTISPYGFLLIHLWCMLL